jgi:hypothetical protein
MCTLSQFMKKNLVALYLGYKKAAREDTKFN